MRNRHRQPRGADPRGPSILCTVDSAVVTGAGRGLGKHLALRLHRRGLAVVVADIDADAAHEVAAWLGEPAQAFSVDVRQPQQLRDLARAAASTGRLSVWVNNAGVIYTGNAWEQQDQQITTMVDVNLGGVINGSRAAIEAMRADGGRILNMASLSSLGPAPGLATYGATKHAVLGFSVSLQAELRHAGIDIEVRALCPDAISGEMVAEAAGEPGSALIFSAPRLLTQQAVADRAIELLYGDRLMAVIPRWRGVLARLTAIVPSVGIRIHPLLLRVGERGRERFLKQTR